ncbi:hypothetical protein ABVT39_019628 [Epinephelus coioides]
MEQQRRQEHHGTLGSGQSGFHPCSCGREASEHRGLGWSLVWSLLSRSFDLPDAVRRVLVLAGVATSSRAQVVVRQNREDDFPIWL